MVIGDVMRTSVVEELFPLPRPGRQPPTTRTAALVRYITLLASTMIACVLIGTPRMTGSLGRPRFNTRSAGGVMVPTGNTRNHWPGSTDSGGPTPPNTGA